MFSVTPFSGAMPSAITLLLSTFQVTGASWRASGYAAPEMPPVPYWLAPAPPELVGPVETLLDAPLPQAASTAAIEGMTMPAAAARRRNVRRSIGGRAFG